MFSVNNLSTEREEEAHKSLFSFRVTTCAPDAITTSLIGRPVDLKEGRGVQLIETIVL